MLCSVFISISSLDIGHMFNLFTTYLILDILCLCGRQESLISVWVGFLYIANSSLFSRALKDWES
jgi:hypothetical protein